MSKLPDHYPAWWCCPVGKPRVVKDMEDAANPSAYILTQRKTYAAQRPMPLWSKHAWQEFWEPKVETPVRIDARTWLTSGGVRAVESIGLVPPGSVEP
jgi:hypothetical protein